MKAYQIMRLSHPPEIKEASPGNFHDSFVLICTQTYIYIFIKLSPPPATAELARIMPQERREEGKKKGVKKWKKKGHRGTEGETSDPNAGN